MGREGRSGSGLDHTPDPIGAPPGYFRPASGRRRGPVGRGLARLAPLSSIAVACSREPSSRWAVLADISTRSPGQMPRPGRVGPRPRPDGCRYGSNSDAWHNKGWPRRVSGTWTKSSRRLPPGKHQRTRRRMAWASSRASKGRHRVGSPWRSSRCCPRWSCSERLESARPPRRFWADPRSSAAALSTGLVRRCRARFPFPSSMLQPGSPGTPTKHGPFRWMHPLLRLGGPAQQQPGCRRTSSP